MDHNLTAAIEITHNQFGIERSPLAHITIYTPYC